jgi:hypothetical protein
MFSMGGPGRSGPIFASSWHSLEHLLGYSPPPSLRSFTILQLGVCGVPRTDSNPDADADADAGADTDTDTDTDGACR